MDTNDLHRLSFIPPRELQEVLAKIEEYRIDLQTPGIHRMLASLNMEKSRASAQRTWDTIKSIVAQYHDYHTLENPFISVPHGFFTTGYIIAQQLSPRVPIKITRDQFARHTFTTGSSGSGKTTIATHIANTLAMDGIRIIFIDAKDDYRVFAVQHPDCLVITPDSPLNIFAVPPYMTTEQSIDFLIENLTKAYYGGEVNKQVMHEAARLTYANHDHPCIADLQETVLSLQHDAKSPTRKDQIKGVHQRLERFRSHYPALCTTRMGISINELFQHSIYVPLLSMNENSEFLTSYLLTALYYYRRLQHQRDSLGTMVVLDEGLLLWNKHQTGIEGTPILSSIHSMVREFGIGMLVTATSVTQTDALFKSNTFLQITMNVTNSHESEAIARTYGLNDQQHEYLDRGLTRGECIIKLADTWPYPILATFPPPTQSKEVSLAEYEAAKRRINAYAPPDLPPQATTQAPPTEEQQATLTPEPTPAPPLSATPAAPPRVPLAPVKPAKPTLSTNEKKLLTRICTVLEPVSTAYTALGFHPTTGNRAKQKLVALGLVEEHVLTVRRGRGNQAHILFPTDAGYAHLNMHRPHGTRGGDSPQHQYLVQTIAALLPESHIELTLAGKSMDIYARYTQSLHHALLDHQQEIFGRNDIAFTEGDHLALEIEVSDPEKTGPANVTQNAAAGIAKTIVLVMGDQLDKTKKLFRKTPHCIVGDALAILDALRGAPWQATRSSA